MRIAVYCQGSVASGLGHLYRSYSFARHAERHCETGVFVRAEETLSPIMAGLKRAAHFSLDEGALIEALLAFRPDVVAIDMTRLSDAALARLRQAGPVLASLSPVLDKASAMDLFFTRGAAPEGLKGPVIHSGLAYAIINAHCQPIGDAQFQQSLASPALSVMVSFGGGDAENHTRLTLEVLRDVERPLLIWAMLGDAFPHSHDELIETIRSIRHHEIILARTNRSMWRVAANCALAILTSGQSTLEAIYAGLPIISMIRVNDPSQQVATEYDHLCVPGGRFDDGSFAGLRQLVEGFHADRDALHALRNQQHGLLDGLGSERVFTRMAEAMQARAA